MKRILIQLDTDPHPSSFDRVVAIDAGVEELFSYGGVSPQDVQPLVHGAMFTRGPNELKSTAIFIGGSDVAGGEELLKTVLATFFGPVRVSVMMDSNGSNTTAAAAVLAASQHLNLSETDALVLGGTGPVGQRAAQLLSKQGVKVRVGSRNRERAKSTCEAIAASVEGATLTAFEINSESSLNEACRGVELIIAAGAAGVELMSVEQRSKISTLKVAVDLNAVPPLGLAGTEVTDQATQRHGVICYGAIGVGSTKMKIHKTALKKLFQQTDHVFDTNTIYEIAEGLV